MKTTLIITATCCFLIMGQTTVKASVPPTLQNGEEVRLKDDSSSLFAPAKSSAVASDKTAQTGDAKIETFKGKKKKAPPPPPPIAHAS